MSENVPKQPEDLQAQLAAFAVETLGSYDDRAHILNNIGSIALEEPHDITRITTSRESYPDGSGGSTAIAEGTEVLVTEPQTYIDYLRTVGGSSHEAISGRADMLREYSRFAPLIDRLIEELKSTDSREDHPAFLGAGTISTAFSVEDKGVAYAVRIPWGDTIQPRVIDNHMASAILGKGIPHLEQVVAASYETGVTIAEMMPGKEVVKLTKDEIDQVTDSQLEGLLDTALLAQERGIAIDPKPSNFFYDPKEGYGIIDYHSAKVAGATAQNQGIVAGFMSTVIHNAGVAMGDRASALTAVDYADLAETAIANIGVLHRYRAIVEGRLSSEDRKQALSAIDTTIENSQMGIDNLLNPEWVTATITRDADWRRKRADAKIEPHIPDGNWYAVESDVV